jgi:HSP20 family protein
MAETNVLDQPTTEQKTETKGREAQGGTTTTQPGGQATSTPGGAQTSQASQNFQTGQTGGGLSRQGQTSNLSRRDQYDLWGNPFSLLRQMGDEMDRLFSDFFDWSGFGGRQGWRSGLAPRGFFGSSLGREGRGLWSPAVEVFERGDQLVIRADLPGLKREDVQVEVQDNALVLSGERRSEHEENQQGLYRSERSYGSFCRTIPLPEGVSPDDVRGSFKDGVLEITMPKPKQQQRGRRIELQEGHSETGRTASASGSTAGSGSSASTPRS